MTEAAGDARRAAEWAARHAYGRLVALLAMSNRDIAAAEDALSEAFASALATWPARGVPDAPEAWLLTAARNRLRNSARARGVRDRALPDLTLLHEARDPPAEIPDERLRLMFVCAHPAIDPAARAPLMLQTVLGLDAAAIGAAFAVPPATMSQRLVRAKARIRDAGLRFGIPDAQDMPERLGAVLDAIYAAFGIGWDMLESPEATEALSGEAVWLARLLSDLMPEEPEPKGLLALMLYCTARLPARRDASGAFVPLARQDARLWNRTLIIEAEGLLTAAARSGSFGRYQCEAAIQSVHVQRPITGKLNVDALLTLYGLLVQRTGSLGARLGQAAVLAEAGRAKEALAALDALDMSRAGAQQSYWVTRAAVLEALGLLDAAAESYDRALALTADAAIRLHLDARKAALSPER